MTVELLPEGLFSPVCQRDEDVDTDEEADLMIVNAALNRPDNSTA